MVFPAVIAYAWVLIFPQLVPEYVQTAALVPASTIVDWIDHPEVFVHPERSPASKLWLTVTKLPETAKTGERSEKIPTRPTKTKKVIIKFRNFPGREKLNTFSAKHSREKLSTSKVILDPFLESK